MTTKTQRIQKIVKSLRNFSRLDEADIKEVDIHEGIDSILMMLEHRLQAKSECSEIKVIKKYGLLPKVTCYSGQLNQVFMNILMPLSRWKIHIKIVIFQQLIQQ